MHLWDYKSLGDYNYLYLIMCDLNWMKLIYMNKLYSAEIYKIIMISIEQDKIKYK